MIEGTETIVFIQRPVTDDYGDVVTPGAEFAVENCIVYPHTSAEDSGRTQTVTTGFTVLAPVLGGVLSAEMTARYEGKDYDIEGDPGTWRFMDGEVAGTQVELTRGRG